MGYFLNLSDTSDAEVHTPFEISLLIFSVLQFGFFLLLFFFWALHHDDTSLYAFQKNY